MSVLVKAVWDVEAGLAVEEVNFCARKGIGRWWDVFEDWRMAGSWNGNY